VIFFIIFSFTDLFTRRAVQEFPFHYLQSRADQLSLLFVVFDYNLANEVAFKNFEGWPFYSCIMIISIRRLFDSLSHFY